MTDPLREFSQEELEKYNGKDENSVYIAFEGKVYDVSASKFWKTGVHMRRHQSGSDLTRDISAAPHGPETLESFPQVGILKGESAEDPLDAGIPDILLRLFEKIPSLRRHPHPITVHFPMAFCLAVPLFNLLYVMTGYRALESTAFHLLVLCLPATLAAMVSGPVPWWLNYGAKMTLNIKVKLIASCILFLLLLIGLFWRLSSPDILDLSAASGWIYLILSFAFALPLSLLGWFGAKMTFPD